MHQLDILISAKCGKLEEEVEFLKNALMKKETKVDSLLLSDVPQINSRCIPSLG